MKQQREYLTNYTDSIFQKKFFNAPLRYAKKSKKEQVQRVKE
jgi:hypothetical protein